MALHSSTLLIPWCIAGLRRLDDDLPYFVISIDTADPERKRQVALVPAWDGEGEQLARAIAALPKLFAACRAVVANWEQGDLAQAARQCQDAIESALPKGLAPAAENRARPANLRSIEYYRLWGGDSGTWDTDFVNVPADTPDDRLDEAVRQAAAKIKWRDEPPVIVGCYNNGGEREDKRNDAELQFVPAPPASSEPSLADLVAKAEAAGLKAEDFDETIHNLASSISADINNSGVPDQIRYLAQEWGHEAAAREIDRLTEEKTSPHKEIIHGATKTPHA